MFDVWKNVLAEIEQAIPRNAFQTWFTDVKLISNDNGAAIISVPNAFKEAQIKTKYDSIIKDAFLHNNVKFKTVEYVVSSSARVRPHSREVSVGEISKKTNSSRLVKSKINSRGPSSSGLNPRYTMDNFIVGSNNNLSVAVAKAVIKNPGGKYNPFFLYSSPGLGKTHLVQAIGNELIKNNPDLNVVYTATSDFLTDFINSIGKNGKSDSFSKKYRSADVLIIDDIQMLVNKPGTQEAFFNIFNDLHQHGKQIIITSDRLPEEIKTLEERLSSRLAWAGAFDLQQPNFEDKCAILKAKAEFEGDEIEDEAIEYIANSVKTNIRDLEREYSVVMAWSEMKGVSPLEVINDGYAGSNNTKKQGLISPKKVVSTVAKFYDLKVDEMCGKSRVSHIKNARQVAMYLLSEELNLSTTKIALEVGVKDHTTVMHGVKRIKGELKDDFALREQVASIRESLYA